MLASAIPCQIHFTDKQRNANVSWDFRLLTVSAPFAHCNEIRNCLHATPLALITDFQEAFTQWRFNSNLGGGRRKETSAGRETLFRSALQDLEGQEGFGRRKVMALRVLKAAQQQLGRASQRQCRPGDKGGCDKFLKLI